MKNKDIENMLKKSCNDFVPDVLDKVKASDTEIFNEELTQNSKKAKALVKNKEFTPNVKRIAFSVCLIIIMIFVSSGTMILAEADDSYIYVDINPSIEIVTKRNGDVKRVIMLNDDAKRMFTNLDFRGNNVEEVIEILIEKAVSNGFIEKDIENEILISVSNNNKKRKEAMLNRVYQKIDNQLAKQNIKRNISKQSITKEEKKKADKIKISAGKLVLINKIIELDPSQKTEELKNKKVSELKAIYKSLIEERYKNEQDFDEDNDKGKYQNDYREYFKDELNEYIQKRKRGN